MFRRQFVQLITLAGVGGTVAASLPMEAEDARIVTFHVKGFSCITCAVGLDTMLQREKGVISSHSTYPDGLVVIRFNPHEVSEESLKSVIAGMGFTAELA